MGEPWQAWSLDRTLGRDLIVVGASAGGVEALLALVAALPADLPAAICVVIHIPAHVTSRLPVLLSRRGPLPAAHARHGELIRHRRIYVAPPDFHLLVRDGHLELGHGPRENHVRPAVDPLFRSAARSHGSRVAGVVLSGTMSDGSLGMAIIKEYGGVCIVQDPDEALFGDMPRAVLRQTSVDYVLPVQQIAPQLEVLARQPVATGRGAAMHDQEEEASRLIRHDIAEQAHDRRAGQSSIYTCPDCGGVLWQLPDLQALQFQCHVGHTYGSDTLFLLKSEALEMTLWSCVRMLRERATMAQQLASRAREQGDEAAARHIEERARLDERNLRLVRESLLEGAPHDAAQSMTAIDALGGNGLGAGDA
jgi:two-component system, chemotaxis family, protein-glutamate methylesterase/glutaminase